MEVGPEGARHLPPEQGRWASVFQTNPSRRISCRTTSTAASRSSPCRRRCSRRLRWPGTAGAARRQPVVDLHDRAPARRASRCSSATSRTASRTPFEVWVNGSEQPRGLGALAKTLSMDMRANDLAWLQPQARRARQGGRRRLRHALPARAARRSACRRWSPRSRRSCAGASSSWLGLSEENFTDGEQGLADHRRDVQR